MNSRCFLHFPYLRNQSNSIRLTEFGPNFLLNSLFILFFVFSLLVSTLETRDGVWHDMMVTQSQVT